jgi:signal peptidase
MEKNNVAPKKNIFKVSLNIFFYLIIIILVAFSIANIQIKRENDIANLFGIGFLAVQSDSMEGSNPDSFNEGDLVFVKLLSDEDKENLKIGDVITFYDLSIKEFNTHRIVDINIEERLMSTKGDKATVNDLPRSIDYALALHIGTLPKVGNAIDYVQSPMGFALFIILPVLLIFVYEGIGLVRNIMALNREKYEEELKNQISEQARLTELEKEQIRKQVLEELKAKKE